MKRERGRTNHEHSKADSELHKPVVVDCQEYRESDLES
jgi:hypothetical protein